MMEVGRVCVKIAGRDSNLRCVIIDVLDEKYVMIDGQTRRKKANIAHLEPLNEVLKIKKNESHDAIAKIFAEKGFEMKSKNTKAKKAKTEKPVSAKVAKAIANAAAKPAKPAKEAKAKPAKK